MRLYNADVDLCNVDGMTPLMLAASVGDCILVNVSYCVVMAALAALCNRVGIIFLPCGFFLLLSSLFPHLISAVGDWMSTILPHMVWP